MKHGLYRHLSSALALCAASLLPVCSSPAQTTNIIDGFASNYPGIYYVGSNTSGNGLIITNGGSLADVSGWIGETAAANSNWARVHGTNSLWTNSDWIILGNFGSYNELRVENGGLVRNKRAAIGMNSSGISNTLVVTDNGSFMDILGTVVNDDVLYLGYFGPRNRIEIRNGGRLKAYDVRLGDDALSASNTLLVTGAGSVWSNRSLYPGYNGPQNRIEVQNGGRLEVYNAYLGNFASSASNTLLVTGTGSVWSNAQNMFVGVYGPFNQLRVEDGGEVYNGLDGTIGWAASSVNNSILVNGMNSILRIGGKFNVGFGGSGGCIMNDSGQVRVGGDVIITTNSFITNYVQQFAGGLDMTSAASSLIITGNMSIVFQKNPASVGHFWGFRKAGNYTATLSNLYNTGKISWSDSELSPFWRSKVSIYYDQTNSYIGIYVPRLLGYTLISVQ